MTDGIGQGTGYGRDTAERDKWAGGRRQGARYSNRIQETGFTRQITGHRARGVAGRDGIQKTGVRQGQSKGAKTRNRKRLC